MLGSSRFFYIISCKHAFLEAKLHTEMGKMVHVKILGSFTQLGLAAAKWRSDKPPAERGFVALAVPIGHRDFMRYFIGAHVAQRLRAEAVFFTRAGSAPGPPWLFLLFCALPRARHLPCSVSPALTTGYEQAHVGSWAAVTKCRMPIGIMHCNYVAGPSRGLGLLAAERVAPSPYSCVLG